VLSELPRITSPDWLTNSSLHVLELEKMKGLRSYASLAGLPSIKTLILRDEVTEGHIVELARLGSLKEIYVYDYCVNEIRAVVDSRSLPLAIKAISFRQGEAPRSNTPVS
jgi:hypothetical protein